MSSHQLMNPNNLPIKFACKHYKVPVGADPNICPPNASLNIFQRIFNLLDPQEPKAGTDFWNSPNFCESCYKDLEDDQREQYHFHLCKESPDAEPEDSPAKPKTVANITPVGPARKQPSELPDEPKSSRNKLSKSRSKASLAPPASTSKNRVVNLGEIDSVDFEHGDKRQARVALALEQGTLDPLTPERTLETSHGIELPGLHRCQSLSDFNETSNSIQRANTLMPTRFERAMKTGKKSKRRRSGINKRAYRPRPSSTRFTTEQARDIARHNHYQSSLEISQDDATKNEIKQKLYLHSEADRCARCDEARCLNATSMSMHEIEKMDGDSMFRVSLDLEALMVDPLNDVSKPALLVETVKLKKCDIKSISVSTTHFPLRSISLHGKNRRLRAIPSRTSSLAPPPFAPAFADREERCRASTFGEDKHAHILKRKPAMEFQKQNVNQRPETSEGGRRRSSAPSRKAPTIPDFEFASFDFGF